LVQLLIITVQGHELRAVDQTRWQGRSAGSAPTSFELHDDGSNECIEIEMTSIGVPEADEPESEPELDDF
jgi:hypothetical protein